MLLFPSIKFPVLKGVSLGIRHQASGIRHQASGIRHQAFEGKATVFQAYFPSFTVDGDLRKVARSSGRFARALDKITRQPFTASNPDFQSFARLGALQNFGSLAICFESAGKTSIGKEMFTGDVPKIGSVIGTCSGGILKIGSINGMCSGGIPKIGSVVGTCSGVIPKIGSVIGTCSGVIPKIGSVIGTHSGDIPKIGNINGICSGGIPKIGNVIGTHFGDISL